MRWAVHGYMSIGSSRVADQRGFVLPGVMFSLAMMGLLAVVAVRTADDERRSERALRESGAVRTATTARSPIIASEKITPGRTNPRWSAARDFPIHRYVCTAYLTF